MALLQTKSLRLSSTLRVVFIYALFSLIWILTSDALLESIAPSEHELSVYQHYKGAAFVVISASLLYLVLANEHRLREKGKQALTQSEERFRRAVHNAPVPTMIHAEDGQVVTVNRAWLELSGYQAADLPTLADWARLAYGERSDAVPQDIDRLYERDERHADGECMVRTAAGRSRIWQFSSAPLGRDASGRRLVISMATDVTERRQAEESLRQAKEEAEAANKAKDHFLAVLSHELRTPLTPVLAIVSAGEETAGAPSAEVLAEEERRQQMLIIRRNIELEARLIDDLLDLTRVTRGMVRLDRRPVSLRNLLQHVERICAPDLEARHITLRCSYGNDESLLLADSARLQQAFWNVLKNAVKYSPRGGVVELRAQSEASGAVVEVQDYGIGIEPAALCRIFAPFEQAEPQPPSGGGGLGLGLTIARAMIELHGGRMEAQSEGRGHGSLFRIWLPTVPQSSQRCATAARPLDGAAAATPPAPPAPPAPLAPSLSILLVEDHVDTSLIMQRLLRRRGHKVKAAADVEDALKLFSGERFDVLLSDLGLPGRSGLDLIRELRRQGSRIPALAVSGFGRDEDIRASREAGFDEHLTKPLNFEQLQETMLGVLAARQ